MNKGKSGRIYNFGDVDKLTNIEVVTQILSIMSASSNLIEYVEDRLGHDYRYAINTERARNELGWNPHEAFSKSLGSTINWYRSKQS
jgi:dTDP-glucose 4,6-dehydratase